MGNFFSMMVCGLFSVFWLSFGVLQLPSWGLAAAYSTTGNAAEGEASVAYNAALALYLVVWGFTLLTFAIFALKTNVVIVSILSFGTMAAFVLSGAYWRVASKDYVVAMRLQKASIS
jgi:succinate-acetate transporter protein